MLGLLVFAAVPAGVQDRWCAQMNVEKSSVLHTLKQAIPPKEVPTTRGPQS